MILDANFKEENQEVNANFGVVYGGGSSGNAVLYTKQNLTSQQRMQARKNIDAVSQSELKALDASLNVKTQKSGTTVRIENAEQNPLDMSIDVQISSKNKAPVPKIDEKFTSNGVRFTSNGDGTVTVERVESATANGGYNIISNSTPFTLPAGTYFFSALPSDFNSSDGYIQLVNKSGGANYIESGKGVCFTLDEPQDFSITLNIRPSFNGTITVRPQIEVGTKQTEFAPYVEDLTQVPVWTWDDDAFDTYEAYPDENGVIENIDICYLATNIVPYGNPSQKSIIVTATYSQSINYVIEELRQAIISLGGNV